MRIGELAKATGLTASRLRFYEKQGILPSTERRENGYRDYPSSAIAVLRFIDQGQALGFTLAELSAALTASDEQTPARADMVAGLQRKHAELGRHIKAAIARRSQIGKLIAELRACDGPDLPGSQSPKVLEVQDNASPSDRLCE